MPEWLHESLDVGSQLSWRLLTTRLIVACLMGGAVAGIYAVTQRRSRLALVPFATTLVLLSTLIAMVTLVIGNNVARAFSLAGALAIIRFRTVVDDTRDTAFVIFSVVVGMAVGAGLAVVPAVGIPIVGTAALVMSRCGNEISPGELYRLDLRVAIDRDPAGLVRELFDRHLSFVRMRGTATTEQGDAMDLSYAVALRNEADALAFVSELTRLGGILGVKLRHG